MEDFCGGPFWDSELSWVAENPDLTFCFQQTALVYVPCAFLWLFSLFEIYYIKTSRYRDIPWGLLNVSKSIFLFALIALTFIDLSIAVNLRESQGLFPVHIVTPIIKICSFILAAFLMHFNKRLGRQSSGLLFIFWFLMFVFAIPRLRSLIQNYEPIEGDTMQWVNYDFTSFMVYFGFLGVLFLLECIADQSPRETTFAKSAKPSPEVSASFVRRLFFQWFDPMTWKGFRKPLDVNDMYDVNPEDTSRELNPVFDKYWYESVEKNKRKAEKAALNGKKTDTEATESKSTNGSILPAMVKAFGGPFWFAGILKLCMDLLQFATPFLLREVIIFVAMPMLAMWKGILLSFALFGVFIITSILNGQYFYLTFLVGFRIRASLINSIFRKAMRISNSAKKDTTVGEIVNLMAVDAQRFFELTSYLHVLWSGPLVIGLAIFFLWGILGPSVLAGLAVMIIMIPLSGVIAAKLRNLQIIQMKVKDERVKIMNEVLNGMKVLKLYAWEPSFEASVLVAREKEMVVLKQAAVMNSIVYFVWSMAPFLVTLASFTTFVLVDENNVLTPEVAFVSLTLFNILRFPMAMFPMMITFVMQSWVSVQRINKFMNNEELDLNNVTHNKSEFAIEVKNGNFTWGGEHTTLKNINIEIKKQNLTAIVGKVGSGKSSLVSALLGEMEKLTGSVNTDGRIAFVPQQAWIQNATLQDNVTFGQKFDKERYDKVVSACALKPDIEMLPGGDQTEIGEKGINLSGGQKQRVALARAVYSNADVYLLDDPLSAVDAHVGKHIFDNVIGPNGLLTGKTRFLVTHGVSFLPFMDEILVVLDGEISESGSYKSLVAQKGAFSEFLAEHVAEKEEEDEGITEDIKETKRTTSISSDHSDKISRNGSVRKRGGSRKSSSSSAGDMAKDLKDKMAANLIEKEESATGSVDMKVYINYFKNIGFWLGSISILVNALMQGFSIYSNIWLSNWSENPDAATDTSVRNTFLGVYGALGVAQALTLFIGSLTLAFGCLNAARFLHNKLLSHSMRLPMSFFDTTPLGRIMNRFSKDVDMVDNTLPMTIRMWLMMLLNVLGVFAVITYSTPWFATVIIPIAIIYFFIQKFYVATSRQLKRLESVTRSPIYSHFGESITGQSTIRAYGEESRFTLESETRVDYNQMTAYPSIIANRWLGLRLEIVGAFVVLFASLFAVIGRENISPATAGLSINYALQISQVLSFLVRMTAEVETNIVAIERMEEYAELPQEAAWKKGEIDPKWPQQGKVQFHDFELRYREGLDLVIKGISLLVNGGEKVGIVGRTGAGKSSLTLALFRIIEAAGGKIEIDEKDISEMGLHSLRSRLTIIPQDPVLFSGTLRMNIDPFNTYSDDDVWKVLENSHLKSFVKGQTAGLSYEVSEGGENLSVGQRQLICLARALLRKTKVLVLDEATAAVDLDTDDLIQKTIRVEFKECTVLTIAHRLNTILDSDKVVVLDNGKIVEYDTPENLMANETTIFHSMARDAGLTGNTLNKTNAITRF